jgi:hypothetical protein
MKRPRRGVSDEGRRLMANVPLPKRVLALLLARRVSANYRRKIYGADRFRVWQRQQAYRALHPRRAGERQC